MTRSTRSCLSPLRDSFTASVFAVQWFAGLFSDRDKSSQQDHSISKGAFQ